MPSLCSGIRALVLVLVLTALIANAQNVRGTILGTVVDSSNSAMSGAKVTVVNEATNSAFETKTGSSGDFIAPDLAPGTYRISASAAGFSESVVNGVVLLANRDSRIDIPLKPGVLTQEVDVKANAPVLNTENATIGNIMDSKTIANLPLNGRTFDKLIQIAAGSTTENSTQPRIGGSASRGATQFSVDGVAYNDFQNGTPAYSYASGLAPLPSFDTVSELKIDSNGQKAEFEGSASVTIVTKSGTNEFHGSVFEFNRNAGVAAKNTFATSLPKPPLNRNEFGGALGGPVWKNRTFFYGGFEGETLRSPTTGITSVPTAAMRSGNFSGLPGLLDPLSQTPFANNQIPTSRIDPRSNTLQNYLPLPNLPGNGPLGSLDNYVANVPNSTDYNHYMLRLDHQLTSKDSLTSSFTASKSGTYSLADNALPNFGNDTNFGFKTGALYLTYNHTFSPTTLNEARVAGFYHASIRLGQNLHFDPRTLFPGLYPTSEGGLPEVNFNYYQFFGDYGGSPNFGDYTLQYVDNFTHVQGRHTIKAGIDFARYRVSVSPVTAGYDSGTLQEASLGRFDFDGRYSTVDQNAGTQPDNEWADFLLGYPYASYRSSTTPSDEFYQSRYSAYAQDDWRATTNLSVSFGLRYMVQTEWRERNNGEANFDFATGQLVIPSATPPPQVQGRLLSAYPIVLDPSYVPYTPAKNNWAPRLGLAYRPFGTSNTVIRAGAGLFYNQVPLNTGIRPLAFSNPPFSIAETFEATASSIPSITLANPFATSSTISAAPAISILDPHLKNAASYQWNFTLERAVAGNIGLRASYVGNRSEHLTYTNFPFNTPFTQAPGNVQPRRPYQPWAGITIYKSAGDSTMNQLQLEAIKRYSQGLTFQIEYSWNRSLDDFPSSGGTQNPYDMRADRGNSDGIRRHILTAAYTYELPFGPGKHWANMGGIAGRVIGGWQLTGIATLGTGTPFSVGFTSTETGWASGRADLVKSPTVTGSEYSWFDTTAFAVPQPFTYGNSARNLLFGPGEVVLDTGLIKDTRIYEKASLQFRAEAFNLPNHTNLGNPNANISSPTVGLITSSGNPRQVQFGMRLTF